MKLCLFQDYSLLPIRTMSNIMIWSAEVISLAIDAPELSLQGSQLLPWILGGQSYRNH